MHRCIVSTSHQEKKKTFEFIKIREYRSFLDGTVHIPNYFESF